MAQKFLDKLVWVIDSIQDLDAYQSFQTLDLNDKYLTDAYTKVIMSFEFKVWSFAAGASFTGSGSQGNMYVIEPIVINKLNDLGSIQGVDGAGTIVPAITHIKGSNDHLRAFRAQCNDPGTGEVTFSIMSASSSSPNPDPASAGGGFTIRYMIQAEVNVLTDT